MKLNIMIRSLHSFATSIEELDWILLQSEKVLAEFLKIIVDTSNQSSKIQAENLHQEVVKLIERFSGLNKADIKEIGKDYGMTENHNTMNMKKTATTRSFKLMETEPHEENEEEFGGFSTIHLPTIKHSTQNNQQLEKQ